MADTAALLESPSPFSPAAEAAAAWDRLLDSHIRMTPWLSTRASGIGDPCERRIYYHRVEPGHEKPHGRELQAIFDLGKHLEVYAVHRLEEMDFEIIQRGKDWSDPALEITGHVDALLGRRGWSVQVPTEIKGLNPYTAGTIEKIEDIRDHPSPWVRKYYDQLQIYLDFEKKRLGLFALLDKSGGGFTFVDCPRDDARIALLKEKALRIRESVRSKTLPDRTLLRDECTRCGFQHLCCPDITYGDAPVVLMKPPKELVDLLARRAEIEATGKEYARIDKRVKDMLPDAEHVIVADFSVDATRTDRAGYSVKPSVVWTRKITRLTAGRG